MMRVKAAISEENFRTRILCRLPRALTFRNTIVIYCAESSRAEESSIRFVCQLLSRCSLPIKTKSYVF